MEKIIIVAFDDEKAIGKNGEIPWHHSEDLKHFREKTTGHCVLMGRKTYESLPEDFRPLPDRENIVLTRSDFRPKDESVKVANSLEEAYSKADCEKFFIAGGASIYDQTLDDADKMIVTEIPGTHDGDTFFPEWRSENWREVSRKENDELKFVEYVKN